MTTTKKVYSRKKISLAPLNKTVDIDKGEKAKLTVCATNGGWNYAVIMPEPKSFRWSSSNKAVSVKNGTITGVAKGKATVTAKTATGRSAKFTIYIN